MGKRIDKVVKVGTNVAAAASLWDRLRAWWRARKHKRTEERQLEAFEAARRTEHECAVLSDKANERRGERCPEAGCERPKWHPHCHCGQPPCPGNHGPRLRPWGARP